MEIQLTKCSAIGADVVGKKLLNTFQQNLQVHLVEMETGSPCWRLPPPSSTDPESP